MKLDRKSKKMIDDLYRGRKHIELTVGILKDGKTEVVHWGPDHKVVEGEEPVYAVGSICKPVTATWLAKYLAEGKLDLETPISAYIPGLPDRYYPDLERLATHTSGFGTEPYTLWTTLPFLLHQNEEGGLFHTNPFRGYPNEEEMLQVVKDAKLKDKVYKFKYSNIGMSLLGYIVGQISGDGFWDGITKYMQEELGLKNTFLGNIDMLGYDKKDNPCRNWQWEKEDVIAPAGALNSTASDMLKFAQMNLDGSLPYAAVCHEKHGEIDKKSDSGLAWRLDRKDPISWHTGSAGPFSAWLGLNRETGNAVFVAVNYGLVPAEDIGFSILRNLK
ncbi:MAG: beta-lactamase family protein [Clostridia bacterium]|nr:beta-lactamase family protein [Clostridia bacterium]MBR5753540.1 beta-lactamase family protein [Clostridia bacterium]